MIGILVGYNIQEYRGYSDRVVCMYVHVHKLSWDHPGM